jgi:hypothetical protein
MLSSRTAKPRYKKRGGRQVFALKEAMRRGSGSTGGKPEASLRWR